MFISKSLLTVSLATSLILLVFGGAVEAASCKTSVRGTGVRSPSESIAQWLAVFRWEYKARKLYGTSYDNWKNAKNARYFCRDTAIMSRGRPGTYCEAVARPCKG